MNIREIFPKSNDPLYVLVLWHMHQPIYRDVYDRKLLLPWVRLHALKDYYDMVYILQDYPDVHITFNIVPSLIEQLSDYTERKLKDSFFEISWKDASALDENEKLFLMSNFFSLNFDRMIQPFPRYRELFELRGHVGDVEKLREKVPYFNENDFRDLQVWFNLSWCGKKLKESSTVKNLIRKGRNFTEEEKKQLLNEQIKFLSKIIPLYKEKFDLGQIEISTSPYYHPILPLVCNINSAREALPGIELPMYDFHYPEDARWHLARALQCYKDQFGCEPAGIWPSEGAVSDDIVPLLKEFNIQWIVSDEEILQASLKKAGIIQKDAILMPEDKYVPFECTVSNSKIKMFFRDHLLSDMIGFTYSTYDAEAAAEDLISRLLLIRKMLPDNSSRYAVPIILDGENAWEYYPENGVLFLKAFYERLQTLPFLKAATFSEYLSMQQVFPKLPTIRSGSWIYGTFSTWIGHKEKNKAWDLLGATRKKFDEVSIKSTKGNTKNDLKKAFRHIMIAEGSDWFWWYGEDHFSEYDRDFDELFRAHLSRAWELMGESPPEELNKQIIDEIAHYKIQRPFELISPVLDGYITDYFEWLAAGYFSNQYRFTTMQQIHRIFNGFYFGFDHENFYLRLDVEESILNDKKYPFIVEILFRKPGNVLFRLEKDSKRNTVVYKKITLDQKGEPINLKPVDLFGVAKIVELGIPLREIGIHENQYLEFAIKIYLDGNLAERMPHEGFITQKIAIDDLEKYYWVV